MRSILLRRHSYRASAALLQKKSLSRSVRVEEKLVAGPGFEPVPLHSRLVENGQAGSQEIYLPRDRCRDGSGLNFHPASFFGRIKQKLTAANINGSRPFAYAKDSLLAKACDRLILES